MFHTRFTNAVNISGRPTRFCRALYFSARASSVQHERNTIKGRKGYCNNISVSGGEYCIRCVHEVTDDAVGFSPGFYEQHVKPSGPEGHGVKLIITSGNALYNANTFGGHLA